MIHKIKVRSDMYNKVKSRKRMFEIRPTDDRNYRVGDTLHYCEVNENGEYTGRELKKGVLYIFEQVEGLKDGYVLLAVALKKGRHYVSREPKDIE